jgi:hypothetical protein
MLRQSTIPVPPDVYTAISEYNRGVGGGPEVVAGTRAATTVNTLAAPASASTGGFWDDLLDLIGEVLDDAAGGDF